MHRLLWSWRFPSGMVLIVTRGEQVHIVQMHTQEVRHAVVLSRAELSEFICVLHDAMNALNGAQEPL